MDEILNAFLSAWWIVAITAAALFVTTFLRGFQNKSVAAGHKRLAFIGGSLMSALDLMIMGFAGQHAGPVIMLACIGAGFGWIAGMYLHDFVMRKRVAEAKLQKKERRKNRIERITSEMIDERLQELGIL